MNRATRREKAKETSAKAHQRVMASPPSSHSILECLVFEGFIDMSVSPGEG